MLSKVHKRQPTIPPESSAFPGMIVHVDACMGLHAFMSFGDVLQSSYFC